MKLASTAVCSLVFTLAAAHAAAESKVREGQCVESPLKRKSPSDTALRLSA
jgi:hypothetical protein